MKNPFRDVFSNFRAEERRRREADQQKPRSIPSSLAGKGRGESGSSCLSSFFFNPSLTADDHRGKRKGRGGGGCFLTSVSLPSKGGKNSIR